MTVKRYRENQDEGHRTRGLVTVTAVIPGDRSVVRFARPGSTPRAVGKGLISDGLPIAA